MSENGGIVTKAVHTSGDGVENRSRASWDANQAAGVGSGWTWYDRLSASPVRPASLPTLHDHVARERGVIESDTVRRR